MAYGINGELLVGKLILGEQLGLYNSGGTMSFEENGLKITNGTKTDLDLLQTYIHFDADGVTIGNDIISMLNANQSPIAE